MEFRHPHFSLSTTFLRWTDNFQFIFVKNVQNATSSVPALHFTVYYTTYKWLKWSKLFKNTWSDVFFVLFYADEQHLNISTSDQKLGRFNSIDNAPITFHMIEHTYIHNNQKIFKKITAVVIKCLLYRHQIRWADCQLKNCFPPYRFCICKCNPTQVLRIRIYQCAIALHSTALLTVTNTVAWFFIFIPFSLFILRNTKKRNACRAMRTKYREKERQNQQFISEIIKKKKHKNHALKSKSYHQHAKFVSNWSDF